MNEAGVWSYVKKGMANSGWHATRIESSAGNGVPDVSFAFPRVSGWIEFKYIPEWPKRPSTKVKLPLRPEQKLWIKTRGEMHGNVWVFVRIEDDFFLLTWEESLLACSIGFNQEDWYIEDDWHNRVNFKELAEILKGGC